MKQLTEIQKQTYDDMMDFYKKEGVPPTVREVADKELITITRLGGVIGFFVGLIQVLVTI